MGRGGSYLNIGERVYWLPDDPSSNDLLDDLKIVKDDAGNPMSPADIQALQAEDDKEETGNSCLSGGPLQHHQ